MISLIGWALGVLIAAMRDMNWNRPCRFLYVSVPTGNLSIIKAVVVSAGWFNMTIIFKILLMPLLKF